MSGEDVQERLAQAEKDRAKLAALQLQLESRDEEVERQRSEAAKLRQDLDEAQTRFEAVRDLKTSVVVEQRDQRLGTISGAEGLSAWIADAQAVLEGTTGRSISLRKVLGEFYGRTQKSGESLLEFSLALRSLQHKSGGEVDNVRLLEQFAEGVFDQGLQRELRRVRAEQSMGDLTELREWAVGWLGGDDARPRGAGVKAVSATVDSTEASSPAVPEWRREIDELKQMVREMAVTRGQDRDRGAEARAGSTGPRRCYQCHRTGHFKAECPERRPQRKGRCYECGSPDHYRDACPKLRDHSRKEPGNDDPLQC
ncbi:PREDICTED: uncharacterized protein LOC106815377 [Priapulus caudatus]|uniref:Uncharacterized protein LOC106815377 n=1 Tax=Priapulus caudatus TaxID=37621 RepID=A0ABM1ESZ6_PRICU|nr:PREDICTED: uncharacterized protein LOC106815377 [Priapulus caudatus]